MSNVVESSGNAYNEELNLIKDHKEEIESLLQSCQNDIEQGDSNYIEKLDELNANVKDYYSRGFSDFLEEMGVMFTDYSEQFEDLDKLIKDKL